MTTDETPESVLARSLDCITETELCALAGIKASTAEQWRKRGKAPPHIRFGTRFLYPREALSEHLRGLVRSPSDTGVAKAAL